MDNQNRYNPSESPKAASAQPHIPKHAAPKQTDTAVSEVSGKHTASAARHSRLPGVRIRYNRLSSNSRYRRRSPVEKLLGSISRFRYFYAGGALLVIAIILLVVLLPGKGNPNTDITANAPSATTEPSATPEATATPEPSATPEATATPEPVPEATKELSASAFVPSVTMSPEYKVLKGIPNTDRALGLPKCEMVDHSYFNDTVFIGDSVSEKLHLFVTKMRKTYPELLGNAKFITTPSLSSRNALKPVSDTSLHPTVRGKKMTIEDAVALSGAKKVYVMLGMNDVGINGVNESAKNLMTLLRKIKDKSPDIQIFVQSATPRMKGDKPTTSQLFKYNMKVYEYCLKYTDYGMYFVDVAYVMRNKYGNLPAKYCSDPDSMAIHFTDKACKEWIKYLYTHALV